MWGRRVNQKSYSIICVESLDKKSIYLLMKVCRIYFPSSLPKKIKMIFYDDFLENYNSLQKKNKQVIYTTLSKNKYGPIHFQTGGGQIR